MKRLVLGGELIGDSPLLEVVGQLSLLGGDLPAQLIKPSFHDFGRGLRVHVMDGHLVKLSSDEAALHGTGLRIWQETFPRLDFEDPHCRLIPRKEKINIQRMFLRPINQLLRRISPTKAKGRFENCLPESGADSTQQQDEDQSVNPEGSRHAHTFRNGGRFRKQGYRSGFVLIEATLAMAILTILGLTLLKLSLNVLSPRQWALQQTVTDAYMTYERAYAQRVPFEVVTSNTSPWPYYPQTAQSTVELGRLPGNVPIMGTVYRSRTPDPGNLEKDNGSGNLFTNPAEMNVWRLQSVVSYQVGGRQYIKTRTVVRSQ